MRWGRGAVRIGQGWVTCWKVNENIGEGNCTPLQSSCLENPMDGGAWWAAVHRVATSRTWLRDFTLTFHFPLSHTGEGNGSPLQCSCLENPRDGEAWWAAVYGVAQGWTRLTWLSSSSNENISFGFFLKMFNDQVSRLIVKESDIDRISFFFFLTPDYWVSPHAHWVFILETSIFTP